MSETTEHVLIRDRGLEWLSKPPILWNEAVNNLSTADLQSLARWLDDTAERIVRLSGYLEARGAAGCGDHGHATAVKQSNRKVAKVRKAIGFTIPKHDLNF